MSFRPEMFLRICSRCHRPRDQIGSRVIHHRFICAKCLQPKEHRHAMESR
jgi:recombinational DNA repair protein (RecF pathway)